MSVTESSLHVTHLHVFTLRFSYSSHKFWSTNIFGLANFCCTRKILLQKMCSWGDFRYTHKFTFTLNLLLLHTHGSEYIFGFVKLSCTRKIHCKRRVPAGAFVTHTHFFQVHIGAWEVLVNLRLASGRWLSSSLNFNATNVRIHAACCLPHVRRPT